MLTNKIGNAMEIAIERANFSNSEISIVGFYNNKIVIEKILSS